MDEEKTIIGSLALREKQPRVITIAAAEQPEDIKLRVAAYARVSSSSEDQLNSFAAQNRYYTTLISGKESWTMVDIYADEGITGTSAEKRKDFQRLMADCRRGKIDRILVKSISRFARNTKECLEAIRELKSLGVGVCFEKENINTLESDSEMLITLLGAFAQAESESISQNVRWGIRQAMREGKVPIQYNKLYAYARGADGSPQIIPAQAEVVQRIYQQYLAGASFRMIANALEADQIPNAAGEPTWTITAVRGILTNEKYCGDVLRQKTFRSDCISGKVIRNTGQLPMYLIENHHEGIVDRKTFDAVQAEMARRNAGKSPSKKNAPTGLTSYASKYALSERLICGECGTLYRRCTWSKYGKKRIVWRCVSRLDYGTKYCHNSPTMDEGRLQRSILAAINAVMSQKHTLVQQVADAMELELLPCSGGDMSMADMDRRMAELEAQFQELLQQAADGGGYEAYTEQFKALAEEAATLKERRAQLVEARQNCESENRRLNDAVQTLQQAPAEIQEWSETLIRQLVETVTVISAEEIIVTLKGGTEVHQRMVE